MEKSFMRWIIIVSLVATLLMGCAQTDIIGCWLSTEGDGISGPHKYFEFVKDGEYFPYIYTVPDKYTYENNDTHITLLQEDEQYMTIIEYSLETPEKMVWHRFYLLFDDGEESTLLGGEEDIRVFRKVACQEREPLNIM